MKGRAMARAEPTGVTFVTSRGGAGRHPRAVLGRVVGIVLVVVMVLVAAGCEWEEDSGATADANEAGEPDEGKDGGGGAGTPPSTGEVVELEGSVLESQGALVSSAERVEEILADFEADRVDEGVRVTFDDDVLFAFDSAEVTAQGDQLLAEMVEVIDYYAEDDVRIHGHTDSVGSADYNRELSSERAQAVADRLVERFGVDGGRLSTKGFGEAESVADNDSERGRAKNRRVEVIVVTDDDELVE